MTEELVRRAVQVWIDHPKDDGAVWLALGGVAGDREAKAQLYEFVPLAFGRHFLAGMGVTLDPEFVRLDRSGRERERGLVAEVPAFRVAAGLAPEFGVRAGERQDGSFMRVAGGSAEVRAVTDLVARGSRPADLVCVPPVLGWRGAPDRPWWRFWG